MVIRIVKRQKSGDYEHEMTMQAAQARIDADRMAAPVNLIQEAIVAMNLACLYLGNREPLDDLGKGVLLRLRVVRDLLIHEKDH